MSKLNFCSYTSAPSDYSPKAWFGCTYGFYVTMQLELEWRIVRYYE